MPWGAAGFEGRRQDRLAPRSDRFPGSDLNSGV